MRLDHYFENVHVNANDILLVNDVDRWIVVQYEDGTRTIVCINEYKSSRPWNRFTTIDEVNKLYFNGNAKIINFSQEWDFDKCLLAGVIIRNISNGKLYTICRESFTYNWRVIALHNGKIVKSTVHAHIFIDYAAVKLLLDNLGLYELMDVIPFGN